MKISIVTVNYNNQVGLQSTLRSVINQTHHDFECLVIDGASSDNSRKVFESNSDERFKFLSEKDSGIFNAMNKGILNSNAQWLLFLNSGDTFFSEVTLKKLSEYGCKADKKVKVIYGDCFLLEKKITCKAREDINCLRDGDSFASHQSMLIRNEFSYDETYTVFGDLDLLAKILITYSGDAFLYKQLIVSVYEGGGVSDRVSFVKRKEKFRSLFNNFGFLNLLRCYIFDVKFYKKIFIWK